MKYFVESQQKKKTNGENGSLSNKKKIQQKLVVESVQNEEAFLDNNLYKRFGEILNKLIEKTKISKSFEMSSKIGKEPFDLTEKI